MLQARWRRSISVYKKLNFIRHLALPSVLWSLARNKNAASLAYLINEAKSLVCRAVCPEIVWKFSPDITWSQLNLGRKRQGTLKISNMELYSWSNIWNKLLNINDCNTVGVFTDREMCLRHPDIKNKSALTSIIKC